jgi:hypothetical protein
LLFAQRQLAGELWLADPERAAALVSGRLGGVQRDVDAARDYWAGYQGPAREVQDQLNDTYLTLNGVEGGLASYGRSAWLLVLFSRTEGGSVVPPGR